MDNFLPVEDALSKTIQEKASLLFEKLSQLRVEELGIPPHCLEYFKGSHYKRLFFSIETSAHLLYRAIMTAKQPLNEIILMDYGAGVGSLYTLAKMIGCKKVIYNDHLPDWKFSAQLMAEAIDVQVDEYIVGDIDDTLKILIEKNIQCSIITSRNVIEHIYNLEHFFKATATHQPGAIIYSSTTANYMNPGSRLKHWLWHRKWEKHYSKERKKIIQGIAPGLNETEINTMTAATRGLAGDDISRTVQEFLQTKKYPLPLSVGSNTCDPANGVWAEHMMKFEDYRQLAGIDDYILRFAPGFWDTHYTKTWKNIMGSVLNGVIKINGFIAFMVSPFIYVIAEKKRVENSSTKI